jgi:hypothetical protein
LLALLLTLYNAVLSVNNDTDVLVELRELLHIVGLQFFVLLRAVKFYCRLKA